MRKLNRKQIELLRKWRKRSLQGEILGWNQLTEEQKEILEKVNIYENMISDVDRFIQDDRFEERFYN